MLLTHCFIGVGNTLALALACRRTRVKVMGLLPDRLKRLLLELHSMRTMIPCLLSRVPALCVKSALL